MKERVRRAECQKASLTGTRETCRGDVNAPHLGDSDSYTIKLCTLEKGEFGL